MKVLFVCIENAGKSQMAEAFANKYGQGKLTAKSAGKKPGAPSRPNCCASDEGEGRRHIQHQTENAHPRMAN